MNMSAFAAQQPLLPKQLCACTEISSDPSPVTLDQVAELCNFLSRKKNEDRVVLTLHLINQMRVRPGDQNRAALGQLSHAAVKTTHIKELTPFKRAQLIPELS